MDGAMMNDVRRSTIDQWLDTNLPSLSARQPITIHIDQLFHGAATRRDLLQAALDAFEYALTKIDILAAPPKVGLVIPLIAYGQQLVAAPPLDVNDVVGQLDREPPSLYVLDWNAYKIRHIVEEYRLPLAFTLSPSLMSDSIDTYYREFRDEMGIRRGWEYSRAIYLEYYSSKLMLGS